MEYESFIFIGRERPWVMKILKGKNAVEIPKSSRNFFDCAFYDVGMYQREKFPHNNNMFDVFVLEDMARSEALKILNSYLPNTFNNL